MRPPLKWHGGKFYLYKDICEIFPTHSTYVEPYGGAGSVLINKKQSDVEVYNDINSELVNFFKVLRDKPKDLQLKLSLTPYAQEEFESCSVEVIDDIERARIFFVKCRQSLGGRGDSFSATLHRSRRGMADVVSGYLSAIDDELPRIADRLRKVLILHQLATDVIIKYDSCNTLFYLDPPYLSETRKSVNVYDHEMTEDDHIELSKLINNIKGKCVISGYLSELYKNLYSEWNMKSFELPNNAAGGKSKRRMTECIWFNF